MKKLVILVVFTLITITSVGQNLENQFYFRLGYSNPSWSQFGLSEQEWNNIGYTNRGGAIFELGSIFMLKKIREDENMAFGINVDYLYFIYNTFNSNNQSLDITLGSGRIGSKVGPSFTFSPIKRMAFDIYAKADFTWISGATVYEDDIRESEDYFADYFSVGFSSGLNIRYSILIIGFEYNTISSSLESGDYEGLFLQNILDEMVGKSSTGSKSKLPCYNLTIGLTF